MSEPYVNTTPGEHHLERVALAGQIRTYWHKVRGVSIEQRWYNTLADDHATPEVWSEAADALVTPKYDYAGGLRIFRQGEPAVIQGEALRGMTNPSVGDLLARRLRDAVARMGADTSPFPSEPPRKLARRWRSGTRRASSRR